MDRTRQLEGRLWVAVCIATGVASLIIGAALPLPSRYALLIDTESGVVIGEPMTPAQCAAVLATYPAGMPRMCLPPARR